METMATSFRSRAGELAAAALLAALCGCSTSPDRQSSLEEATLRGTVKVRGKLLPGGELNFNAVNPNRRVDARKATITRDGTYEAKVYVGQNIVTVVPPRPRNDQEGKDFFGVNYEEKLVNVSAGANTADLDFLP
jgi:hypothetical protein